MTVAGLPQHGIRLRWRIFGFAILLFGGLTLSLALLLSSLSPGPEAHEALARYVGHGLVRGYAQRGDAGVDEEVQRLPSIFASGVALHDPEGTHLGGTPIQPPLPADLQALRRDGVAVYGDEQVTLAVMIEEAGQSVGIATFHPVHEPRPWWHHIVYWSFAALVTAAASFLFARHLARPLEALSEVATRLGRGELDARMGSARLRPSQETAQLVASFDEMAERIGALVDEQQQLLANISHELRTPLARLRVAAELARQGDTSALENLDEDVSELDHLVAQVLTLTRLDLGDKPQDKVAERMRPERLAVDQLLKGVVDRFRRAHPRRTVHGTQKLPVLEARVDRELVSQAVSNLLENADKYSPPSQPIRLGLRRHGAMIEIEVEDEGEGIDREELPHVLVPFYRGAAARRSGRPGHGLGLCLVDRVARAHGGSVKLQSSERGGTVATVSLATDNEAATQAFATKVRS
ncbi:MAG: ATP-binding protein [Myxococcota bacterium]